MLFKEDFPLPGNRTTCRQWKENLHRKMGNRSSILMKHIASNRGDKQAPCFGRHGSRRKRGVHTASNIGRNRYTPNTPVACPVQILDAFGKWRRKIKSKQTERKVFLYGTILSRTINVLDYAKPSSPINILTWWDFERNIQFQYSFVKSIVWSLIRHSPLIFLYLLEWRITAQLEIYYFNNVKNTVP